MKEEHEYHTRAAPDVTGRANIKIWFYFLLLGIALFLTIGGLTIFFRFQVDKEQLERIGQIDTKESMDQRSLEEAILSGKSGIFPDKKYVSIETAMKKFLSDIRAGNKE